MALFQTWPHRNHGHTHRSFIGIELVPHAALAKHVTMIGDDKQIGVVELADLPKRLDKAANKPVKIARHGEIGVAGLAKLIGGDVEFILPYGHVLTP